MNVTRRDPRESPLLCELIEQHEAKELHYYSDLFTVQLTSKYKWNPSSANDIPTELAKSFYGQSNRVFTPERLLLSATLKWSDKTCVSFKKHVEVGTEVLYWKVVSKSQNELILCWNWKAFGGINMLLGYDEKSNTVFYGGLLPLRTSNSIALAFFKFLCLFHETYARFLLAETAHVLENRMANDLCTA